MPKLNIIVARPKSKIVREAIINIRAEANMLLTSLARELSCLILGIQNLKIRIVSRQVIYFVRMSRVFIKIAYKISYKIVFFLVNYITLILLRQLFARMIKLSLKHPSNNFIDAIFINLST